MTELRAIRATVSGRVQGVGFRYATVATADELGVVGWARNTVRGSVEVHGQGSAEDIDAFLAFLRTGPLAARVAGVSVIEVTPDPEIRGFGVRA